MYPLQVEVNEANIQKLTQTFKTAYASIVEEIQTATDFGVANRKAILAQIEQTLTGLGVDVQKFLETELPQYYKSGADDAVKQLKNVGADVGISEGFNRVHDEAIAALVDDASRAFGESMTGVNRSAQLLLGKVSREALTQKIAEGVIGGKARAEVGKIIKGTLQDQGLDALVDKAGHSWSLDRYADMLFRTKVVEARNRGLINRMVENNYDLVQVSSHPGTCQICESWQGQILSARGETPGYPTVAEAEAAGLFHPNCRHAINTLIPSLAKLTQAYNPEVPTVKISEVKARKVSKVIVPKPSPAQTIHLEAGKNSHDVPVRPWEYDLIKERGLQVQGTGAPRNYGVYIEHLDTAVLPRLEVNTATMAKAFAGNLAEYQKQVERTFYHEVGHFIDYRYAKPVFNTFNRFTTHPEVLEPLQKEAKAIVYARFEHNYLNDTAAGTKYVADYGLTRADVERYMRGERVDLVNNKTGAKGYIVLTRKKYNYYWGAKEVFADAYAQYRTIPDKFKEYAPKMFDFFEKLGGAVK